MAGVNVRGLVLSYLVYVLYSGPCNIESTI